MAVIVTGVLGWVLNVALVFASGDITLLPGPSGLSFLTILYNRVGKAASLSIWIAVCLVAFFTVQTALQANSRTFFAFSRDQGLPDRGVFGKINKMTKTPIYAVWLVVAISVVLGLLSFASQTAVNAIVSPSLPPFYRTHILTSHSVLSLRCCPRRVLLDPHRMSSLVRPRPRGQLRPRSLLHGRWLVRIHR